VNASVGRRVGEGEERDGRMGTTLYEAPETDAPVVVPERATLNSVSSTSQPAVQTQFRDG